MDIRTAIRTQYHKLKKHKVLFWGCLSLIVLAVFAGLWSLSLFDQLQFIASQRSLRRPISFYGDIEEVKTGMKLRSDEFVQKLINMGYFGQSKIPSRQYCYMKSGTDRVDVFFHRFKFPDGTEIEGLYRFYFSQGTVVRIVNEPENAEISCVKLEPVLLGGSYGDGVENRPWVTLEKIHPMMVKGIVECEDRRFYSHLGIDPVSVLRALWVNIRKKGIHQGGSTLTQQLVKNAFLTPKRTLSRKVTEAMLSILMELRYSKGSILEMYLNQIYLGRDETRGIYGVEDASLSYFGKHVYDLTLSECALILGLIPSPNKYSPRISFEKAVERRDLVLEVMLKSGIINMAEWRMAKDEPLALVPLSMKNVGNYYLTYVREILDQTLSGYDLDFAGLKVYTAMDAQMQRVAERVMFNQPLQGALIAMDPGTGAIKAMVGGRNYSESTYNRAVLASRQPGSAFKPIVYAAALQAGSVNLADILEDEPVKMNLNGTLWEPRNFDGRFCGTTTVRDALVYSRNIPSIHVLEKTGYYPVVELAVALGIRSGLIPVPSLVLGTSEVTPLEMTSAYAAFANGGKSVKPLFILWVTDSYGNVILENHIETEQAMTQEAASLLTDVLRDVIARGTGKNVLKMGFTTPVAGKTGTSDDNKDAWFIGYTRNLLCGVWLGHDKPQPLESSASNIALPVWVNFMNGIGANGRDDGFVRHPGLVEKAMCMESLKIAKSGCPRKYSEVFLKNCLPAEHCGIHGGGFSGFFKKIFKK